MLTRTEDILLALNRALSQSDGAEFALVFQPEICVRSHVVRAAEALLRWTPEGEDPVSPAVFIPLAEQAGWIDELTDFVLERALHAVNTWWTRGFQFPVAINLSALSLQDEGFVRHLAHRVEAGAPYGSVCFELTETAAMGEPDKALKHITMLAECGVDVHLDDFGTGYSSLAQLQRLPVKAIKIDGSFIRAMNTEYSARTLVAAIASLAGKFGLTTVAESVERLSDFEDLRRFKVDLAQGFAIARPMSLAAFQDWLDAWPNRLIGSSEPRLPAKANPSRVVLLEDDVQMRCLLHEFLEEDGHKVNVAHDFKEAVALCKERGQPDLLVTDVHLNDSPSGLTLLEALRAEQPNLKALLISGGASLAKPYGKPGPDTPLLQKPFSRTDFLRQVRALLFEQS